MMKFENTRAFAAEQDTHDPVGSYRDRFYFPHNQNGEPLIYFSGNSLGLQPKTVNKYIQQELEDWQKLAVSGHMHGKNPWFFYHHFFEDECKLVGALPDEVVLMNSLTVNIHLLLVSFYQPKGKRSKVMIEAAAFPSDRYAVETQIRMHGLNPDDHIIEIAPREGEYILQTDDILYAIENHKDELALVFLGGVNYYSGQYLELKRITDAAHEEGIKAGFDLAHAAGNVLMHLHDWEVDFAAWCTYKYLNSGPGGVSGIFVHDNHGENTDLLRLGGWWGNDEETRFGMPKHFHPQPGAAGWQISNASIFPMAIYKASLDIFSEVGMTRLREKSEKLTGFLEWVIVDAVKATSADLKIITPPNRMERGCQLSVLTGENGKAIFGKLKENDVVADWREPNVIRIAPVPLYNSFMEVFEFGQILKNACEKS